MYGEIMGIGMLHNVSKDTFHPIFFRYGPLPGHPENLVRLKSAGHHTNGFASIEEAKGSIDKMRAERPEAFSNDCGVELTTLIPWDGTGIPAMTAFLKDSKLILL